MTNKPMYLAALCAAMLCGTVHGAEPAPVPVGNPEKCAEPFYPMQSSQYGEDGVSLIGFLVDIDGKVARTVALSSSGSPRLDKFAQDAVAECRFAPWLRDGKPAATWLDVADVWTMEDDPVLVRAKTRAARRAGKGDVEALFQLYQLLTATAKKDADRVQALVVLQSAAEGGHAHAQYELGRHIHNGIMVQADPAEALLWYRKAAAQGDVFARQQIGAMTGTDEKKAAP